MVVSDFSLKGIDHASAATLSPDGACQYLLNLRPQLGSWRATGAKQAVFPWADVAGYQLLKVLCIAPRRKIIWWRCAFARLRRFCR